MRPLTCGTSLSACTTAFTKNDMNPSFTPCFFMKSSCTRLRSSMTSDMSTSLKVVRIAAVCWALTSWVAILRHNMLILRRVVRPSDTGAEAGWDMSGLIGEVVPEEVGETPTLLDAVATVEEEVGGT